MDDNEQASRRGELFSSLMTSAEQKARLRQEMLRARATLPPDTLSELGRAIFEHWEREFQVDAPANVHVFRSMLSRNEIDTAPFISWARARQVEIVSPRVERNPHRLVHHLCPPGHPLPPGLWGIPEPPASFPLFPLEQLQHILVPLLAFDARGHRLGYGGGYYDRFLAGVPEECLKVGLCLEIGRLSQPLPSHQFDISLDAVVTEQGVHWFRC